MTRRYFCEEPWVGIFSIRTDGEVICCPCYAKVPLGNIRESSMQALWNSEAIVEMRRSFARGELPAACRGQLCPPVLDPENHSAQDREPDDGGRA